MTRVEAIQLLRGDIIPSDRYKCTSGHHAQGRDAPNSSILVSARTLISPDLTSRTCVAQRELMDGLNTPCLLQGRFVVTAREETTHDDVVGRWADAAPEREIG